MSVTFTSTSVKNLYTIKAATGWIGYLFPVSYTDAHKEISLEDSLNVYEGIYLFASKKPDIQGSKFITSIWYFLNNNFSTTGTFGKRCLFWLNIDNVLPEIGFGQVLVFSPNDKETTESLVTARSSQCLSVNGSILMAVPPFCKLSIVNDQIQIARQPLSTPEGYKYGTYINNITNNEFFRLGDIDKRGVKKETPITIPMTGINGGCFQFALSFPFTFNNLKYFEYGRDKFPYEYNSNKNLEYTILESGVKYYYNQNDITDDVEMVYLLFNQETPSGFKASIDFSDLFNTQNPRRTYFAFTGKNIENQQESGSTQLPSNFQTNFGKEIQLTPVVNFNSDGSPAEDHSLLVFSKAVKFPNSNEERYYWVPQGDFTLESVKNIPISNKKEMLLCGISGTETISFNTKITETTNNTTGDITPAYSGDRISFKSKNPAYATQFNSVENSNNNVSTKLLLTNKFTTSWANIVKAPISQGVLNSYFSQPNQAPLFEQGLVNGTLDYAEVPSANLIALDDKSFPIATSAKATPVLGTLTPKDSGYYTQKDIRLFEKEVLNPSRKKIIAKFYKEYKKNKKSTRIVNLLSEGSIENLTTTPQGFLVNLNANKTEWKSLTLANNQKVNNNETKTDTSYTLVPLRFNEIDTKSDITGIQSAFQTNEQFLVISNPAKPNNPEILDYYINNFQDKIAIADWPFVYDIAHQNTESNTSAKFTNIMIFKFCNKSIEERILDTKLWTDPTIFNEEGKIPELITFIQNYIKTARKSVNTLIKNEGEGNLQSQGFQQFLNIIEDKNWHGVLTLQVTLNLEKLPSEIKAILAGIDTSRFAAHHVGIEANQIKTNNNKLDTNFKSSLFGMISYFNATYLDYQNGIKPRPKIYPETPSTYDFQVLNLQVLFKNSLITDFRSKIQLNLNQVFDELVIGESVLSSSAIYKNSIVMDGQYDKKNSSTSYTFSVATPNTLSLNSVAINTVTITGIEMSTIDDVEKTPPTTALINGETITTRAKDAQLTTRFIISGELQFQTIEHFDMFSYESLVFSNLMLDMQFGLKNISPVDQTPKKIFTFLPGNIVFSRSNNKTRPGSLVPNFPIELEDLLYHNVNNNTKAITTSSLGYRQVDAPVPTAPVGNTWYALRFKLNMGSLGALASKVGFNSEVILAWSPGKPNNQAQVYAKMPFSGGVAGTKFSIEGVLKFAIGSILFFNKPETNEYSMIFTEVGVSLLGQKLPPSGSTVLYLFGNPDSPSADGSGKSNVGWFGAYKK